MTRSQLCSLALCSLLGLGCATAPRSEPQATAPATPAQPAAPAQDMVPASPLRQPPPLVLVTLAHQDSPIVSLRLVFHSGSVDDPQGKEGLTALTAALLVEGGTQQLSSAQFIEALYPMAAELGASTDKEFTTFAGRIHKDHLPRFLELFTSVLLEPRYDPAEFERLRQRALSTVRNTLRNENDELLGQVALDALLFRGHPYAHFVQGTVQGLESLTLEDVKAQAARVFTQDRLVVGLAGPVDKALEQALRERLSRLPPTGAARVELPAVPVAGGRVLVLQKPTLSTAISAGYPTTLRRGHPDFYAVAFALSYLGEHRQTHGLLFQELREKRGFNYGNYAYAEHFLQEGGSTYGRTNVARTQQDISLWLRPVVPTNAVFATRGALYFLQRLVDEGMSREDFERTRGFLTGYTRLWEQTDQRRLGYAIDSLFYGTPDFLEGFRSALATLTPEQVQAAVRRHVRPESLSFVFVTQEAEALASTLQAQPPSPVTYSSPKPAELLEEDKRIQRLPLPVRPQAVEVQPASSFMER